MSAAPDRGPSLGDVTAATPTGAVPLLAPERTPVVCDAVKHFLAQLPDTVSPASRRSQEGVLCAGGACRPGVRSRAHRVASGRPPLRRDRVAGVRVGSLTRTQLAKWSTGGDGSPHLRRRTAIVVRQFAHRCVTQGWRDPDAVEQLTVQSTSRPAPEWLQSRQLRACALALELLCERDPGLYDSTSVFTWRLAIETGMRPGEMVEVRPMDLDRHAMRLTVHGDGLTAPRQVPVTRQFIRDRDAHVHEHELGPGQFMLHRRRFVSVGGLQPRAGRWEVVSRDESAPPSSLRAFVRRLDVDMLWLVDNGEMDAQLLPQGQLSPSVWRSTFACQQLLLHRLGAGGMGLEQLSAAMGHADVRVTVGYVVLVERHLEVVGPVDADETLDPSQHPCRDDEEAVG